MTVSRIRQGEVHTRGDQIDDSLDPPDHDVDAANLADTLDYFASQFAKITGEDEWEDPPAETIKALAARPPPHVIQDEGSDLPQRGRLNFVGVGVTASDDAGNDATLVNVVGGGGALPPPDQVGQVILSLDGVTFETRQPITTEAGWLVNDEGHLLVVGC